MTDNKKPQIVFAPGCFDDFDGTPEELAEFIQQLTEMAESGELFENAEPMTEEDEAELEEVLRRRASNRRQ